MAQNKRRRNTPPTKDYAAIKRQLSPYVKFGFKSRTRFNRGEKSAITKALNKYGRLIKDIDEGTVKYKDIKKKKQLKSLKSDYVTSNKGVFVYDKDPNLKIKVLPSGLEFQRQSRSEIFVPFERKPGRNFAKWALEQIKKYDFDYIAMRVGMNHGLTMYDPVTAERYLARDIYRITKEYSREHTAQPFTGLFFIYTGGQRQKQLEYNAALKEKNKFKNRGKRKYAKKKT